MSGGLLNSLVRGLNPQSMELRILSCSPSIESLIISLLFPFRRATSHSIAVWLTRLAWPRVSVGHFISAARRRVLVYRGPCNRLVLFARSTRSSLYSLVKNLRASVLSFFGSQNLCTVFAGLSQHVSIRKFVSRIIKDSYR